MYTFRENNSFRYRSGSALILTVVLTSLLAILGTVFLMSSRIDKMASSSAGEDKQLDLALESTVEIIKETLKKDIPGPNEYYDYPGPSDPWLASLEPYEDGSNYKWRQISDLTGYLKDNDFNNIEDIEIIPDAQAITVDSDGELEEQWADADGDGVADSKWFELSAVNSSKGKKVYAAVRIIDNGGMINVNTALKFDPDETQQYWDGTNLYQINAVGLTHRPNEDSNSTIDEELLEMRKGEASDIIDIYEEEVTWRYLDPCDPYWPFDISDELELRNRFLLNAERSLQKEKIFTRIESWNEDEFSVAFKGQIHTPVGTAKADLDDWYTRFDIDHPNNFYCYRHLATTYNMDRITGPDGNHQINLNKSFDVNSLRRLYENFAESLPGHLTNSDKTFLKKKFAQFAVNLYDRNDTDLQPYSFNVNDGNLPDDFYGIEPYPVISEVALHIDVNDPRVDNEYAVELYNPFDVEITLDNFALEIRKDTGAPDEFNFDASKKIPAKGYFLIYSDIGIFEPNGISIPSDQYENLNIELCDASKYVQSEPSPGVFIYDSNDVVPYDIVLKRDIGSTEIFLDRQVSRHIWIEWSDSRPANRFYYKKFNTGDKWHALCASRMMDLSNDSTLYDENDGSRGDIDIDIAIPDPFITTADLYKMWTLGPKTSLNDAGFGSDTKLEVIYDSVLTDPNVSSESDINPLDRTIGEKLFLACQAKENDLDWAERSMRLNMRNPRYSEIINYFTVFDPRSDLIDNDSNGIVDNIEENKVPGRININTAPAYVIAQLPWITQNINDPNRDISLAEAICAYRDKTSVTGGGNPDYSIGRYDTIDGNDLPSGINENDFREDLGFASIGELAFVIAGNDEYRIDKYALDTENITEAPDITVDSAVDDFKERDIIINRISNLTTVRSDVFTAYLLVRIGEDGPQKRAIAIFDRSGVGYDEGEYKGSVKLRCFHMVPQPR